MTLTSSVSGVAEGRPAEAEETRDRKCWQLSSSPAVKSWREVVGRGMVAQWRSGSGSFPGGERCACSEGKDSAEEGKVVR